MYASRISFSRAPLNAPLVRQDGPGLRWAGACGMMESWR
jgi:hypothetical protein